MSLCVFKFVCVCACVWRLEVEIRCLNCFTICFIIIFLRQILWTHWMSCSAVQLHWLAWEPKESPPVLGLHDGPSCLGILHKCRGTKLRASCSHGKPFIYPSPPPALVIASSSDLSLKKKHISWAEESILLLQGNGVQFLAPMLSGTYNCVSKLWYHTQEYLDLYCHGYCSGFSLHHLAHRLHHCFSKSFFIWMVLHITCKVLS